MSTLTKNDCGVTTILPMSIDCSVVDATTPLTSNGRIYLNITGGSSPYNISWSNGQKTQTIKNLTVGSYTGTVVDYYGDYTATTVCQVDSIAIYVDYFQNCYSGDYLYLTGLTTSNFELSKVYRLTNNLGCYTYSGQTIVSGVTLTADTFSSGPYETCDECDPPPTPLPYYPTNLCLYTNENTYIAYPFTLSNFVNDRPTYTGTSSQSSGYTITWSTGSTFAYWVVSGYTQLKNTSDTFNPLGGWKLEGTNQNWVAISGTCPTIQALTFTTTINDETCEGNCDGSVIINAVGGTGGYTYSLDNVSYGASATFKKLCPQLNTPIYVKDSSGNTAVGSFTILPGAKRTQYTVSIDTKQYYTTQNWGSQTIKRMDYEVKVTPPLPDGITITTPLVLTLNSYSYSPGQTNIGFVTQLYSGTTSVPQSSSGLTTSGTTKRTETNCTSYSYTSTTYSVQYNDVVLKKGLTVSGSVISTINKVRATDTIPGCECVQITMTNVNPTNWVTGIQYYDCNNVLQTTSLKPDGSKTVCGCKNKASNAGGLIYLSYGFFGDACGCLTNGTSSASVNFNGTKMSGCATLIEQTPQTGQLFSSLYQPTNSGGNGI
jgi:hypothetical protein